VPLIQETPRRPPVGPAARSSSPGPVRPRSSPRPSAWGLPRPSTIGCAPAASHLQRRPTRPQNALEPAAHRPPATLPWALDRTADQRSCFSHAGLAGERADQTFVVDDLPLRPLGCRPAEPGSKVAPQWVAGQRAAGVADP